jgi:ubiquinone/menaquinone biosynthesis C-methylase UbiE
MTSLNVFAKVDAQRYDNARPFFHPYVYERLKNLWDRQLDRALDVACGTGQSAEALLPFAREVIAVDPSEAMLSHARLRSAIRYVRAAAERLPFLENSFDSISVGLGIHWFDQPAFLREARRALRGSGWLIVYDSGFPEIMQGNDDFAQWLRAYRERFPAPTRGDFHLEERLVQRGGFQVVRSETFTHTHDYDFHQFATFVATQSRVVRALNNGRDTENSIRIWFEETLRPQFKSPVEVLKYEGWLAVYRVS